MLHFSFRHLLLGHSGQVLVLVARLLGNLYLLLLRQLSDSIIEPWIATRNGRVQDLALITVSIVKRAEELTDHTRAHPLIGPQTLVAKRLLLLFSYVIGAGLGVPVYLQQLREDHFLFFAQLGRFAK